MMKKILAILLSLMMLMTCVLAEEAGTTAADTAALPGIFCHLPSSVEELVHMIAGALTQREHRLDIRTPYGSHSLYAGSSDGETIQLVVRQQGVRPVRVQIDGERVSISGSGDREEYTYPELAEMLLLGTNDLGIVEQLLQEPFSFDGEDLDFLKMIGETVVSELKAVGAIPDVRYVNGNAHFSVSITPDLIAAAGVRLVEDLLNHTGQIDSLLERIDPLLRMAVPDLFEQYDSETGLTTQREAYTCAELQQLFRQWYDREWLRGWFEFGGIHLDASGFSGRDGWNVDASLFVPEGEFSIWLTLNGDDRGGFSGSLEYCGEGYSRAAGQWEMQNYRFDISGEITMLGASLRVRPETPLNGFTGLRIDCMTGASELVIDAATDVLDLRIALSENRLDFSAAAEELLLDLHLTDIAGYPQGSLVCRDYYDAFSVTLNQSDAQPAEEQDQPGVSEETAPETAAVPAPVRMD